MPAEPAQRLNVFFYGLFMDAEVLRSHGVTPSAARMAFIVDHTVQLGAKAMLQPAHGRRAWGMLYSLTRGEFDALYAEVPGYREASFPAHLDNGNALPAISMVHRQPPIDAAEDPAYARQWRALVQRLELPFPLSPGGLATGHC